MARSRRSVWNSDVVGVGSSFFSNRLCHTADAFNLDCKAIDVRGSEQDRAWINYGAAISPLSVRTPTLVFTNKRSPLHWGSL